MNNGFDLTAEELEILTNSTKEAIWGAVGAMKSEGDVYNLEEGAKNILARIELLKKLQYAQDQIGGDVEDNVEVAEDDDR